MFSWLRESAENSSREEFEAQHPECWEPGSVEWRITHTGNPGSEQYDPNFHFDAETAEQQINAYHDALSAQQEQIAYERDSEIGDLKARAGFGKADPDQILSEAKRIAKVTEIPQRCNDFRWTSNYKEVKRAEVYARSLLRSESDVPRERYVPVFLPDGSYARDEKTNAIITIAQQIPPAERWEMLNEVFDGNADKVDEIINLLERAEHDATTHPINEGYIGEQPTQESHWLVGRKTVNPSDLYNGQKKKKHWSFW